MSDTLRAAILTIGSELLRGDGLDTNSAWISTKLDRLGIDCRLHASCPDDLDGIVAAIGFAAANADVVVVTGGLGPTTDDLTRQAVSRWADRPLRLDEPSLEHMRALFARFKREMPDSNRVQAEVPEGARVLQNDVGTATCFALEHEGTLLYALPGVPREVYWVWNAYLEAELRERSGREPRAARTFRTVGISESALGERLTTLLAGREGIEVRYAAEEKRGTIRVTLIGDHDEAAVEKAYEEAREVAGDHVCALGEELLPEAVFALLKSKELTVATAESCTGGRVAAAITGIPGSSWVFERGFVTYCNGAKTDYLGVPEDMLAKHGAVSKEVALSMARGVRERTGANLGLGVTGIAGPGGGSDEKPVGTVHMAVAGPGDDDILHMVRVYPGDRALIQTRATAGALDMIRRAATRA